MDLDTFEASLRETSPPPDLEPALVGLWHAGRGAWDLAHAAVQDDEGRAAAWVHAWLHRDEGDLPNADYWYRRAGRTRPSADLRTEWRAIVEALLAPPRP